MVTTNRPHRRFHADKRRLHRSISRHVSLFAVGFATLVLTLALGGVAGASLQGDPTEGPGVQFLALPTQEPDMPIRVSPTQPPPQEIPNDFQANPTQVPPQEIPDDFQANPTQEPPQEIPDDFRANPTQVPPQDIPDDFQANPTPVPPNVPDDLQALPTEVPEEDEIDDLESNPVEPSTLTVRKWVCPPFYDPYASDPMADCSESSDTFTFELDNHDAGQSDLEATTGDKIEGAAVFQPQPGTHTLSEQAPEGFDQPFLWACVDLNNAAASFPSPSLGNTYELEIGINQAIECDWMNVIDNDNHIVTVQNLVCAEGVDPADDYWQAIQECTTWLGGVNFSLTTEGGTVEGTTDAGGGFVWTDVDLGDSGEIQIQEDLQDGYGEPEVWCTSFPEAAADPFDYEFFPYQAPDGMVVASPEQHEPYRFSCVFLNIVADGPGQEQSAAPSSSVIAPWAWSRTPSSPTT